MPSGYLLSDIFAGKEGPVHDVLWSYSGSEFAVVYGCIHICLIIIQFFKQKPLQKCLQG